MHLTKELFVVPDEGNYILYAPLKGKAMRVNDGTIGLLKRVTERMDLEQIRKQR